MTGCGSAHVSHRGIAKASPENTARVMVDKTKKGFRARICKPKATTQLTNLTCFHRLLQYLTWFDAILRIPFSTERNPNVTLAAPCERSFAPGGQAGDDGDSERIRADIAGVHLSTAKLLSKNCAQCGP